LHNLAGRNLYFFLATLRFSKNAARTCPSHLSEFIVSENKLGQIVLVTLRTHHSFTLMSRNRSLYTILGLSTCQCLLLWVLTVHWNKTTFTPMTFMETLLNMLQYLTFLLMEYIMLTLTSITKNILFRMCSPIIWFHTNWNAGKPTYKFAQTCCTAFLHYTGSDNTYYLWYLVLHIHEQQFTYVGHNTGNWTVDSTCYWY